MSSGRRITIMIAVTIAILVIVRFAEFTDFEDEQAAIRSAEGAAAANEADSIASASQEPFAPKTLPSTLSLVLADGSPTTLFVDDTTDVVVMATWCPYSVGLKNLLNDPRAQQYEAHRRLVFVFERDEMDEEERSVRRQIVSGEIRPEEVASALESLKNDVPRDLHANPAVLLNLPGEPLFWDRLHPITYSATPQMLTGPGPHFELHTETLLRRMGMPRELAASLLEQYYNHAKDPKPAGGE